MSYLPPRSQVFAELNPPYKTIVADPPWDYGADGGRWPSSSQGTIYRQGFAYSTMSLAAICDLGVADLADHDCRLFLWTTNAFLFESPAVLDSWGFEYRQTLVWHKTHQPSPFGGSVAPNTAEFLIVATTGKPVVVDRGDRSVIAAPRARAHSTKPPAFYDFVERVSPGPYAELFARAPRLGWDHWGYGYEEAS